MRAAWWWIDRWRKSTAYTDMTLAEQGAYRNLLDELWLRDGVLPDNERTLARACGDPLAWSDVRDAVLAKFTKTPEGWRNDTHDAVMKESKRKAANQAAYRERKKKETGNVTGNVTADVPRSPSPSPSPSQDQTPNVSVAKATSSDKSDGFDVPAWFVEQWNEIAGGVLPKILKVGKRRRKILSFWGDAERDPEIVRRAIAAFASWDFALEKQLSVDTFLVAEKRDRYLEWAANGPPKSQGGGMSEGTARRFLERRLGNARDLEA